MAVNNVYKATMDLLHELMVIQEQQGLPMSVLAASRVLTDAVAAFDEPEHICPLCGQAKEQTALLELLGASKSLEIWGDDGQSWTINVAECDGNLDKIVGLMLDVKRGTYESADPL